jgi:large subunit ribosomal protein L4
MLELEVRDTGNNTKGKIALREDIFNNQSDPSIVHTATLSFLANQRQGTHATKTRALVSGGGKKPWKQKHTGRARHGSIRSPLWRGGGIVFGPQPRDYSVNLPKKVKKNALFKALTMKLNDREIMVIDSINLDKPMTKQVVGLLNSLGLQDKKVLILTSEIDRNLILSARNIPTVDVMVVRELNAYFVALYDYLLFTEDAVRELQKSDEVEKNEDHL